MPSTQCLRVARFLPLADPLNNDVVQVSDATNFITRFIALPTVSAPIPFPTKEGDLLQANAALAWIAAQADGGAS